VGIATTKAHADQYADEDFEEVDVSEALLRMSRRGDGTKWYITVTENGYPVPDRFSHARSLRHLTVDEDESEDEEAETAASS
jgi:hypothetical protein